MADNPNIINYDDLFGKDIEAKAEAFDRIAERFYCHNFGTLSKSDIDLLMFDILLERCIEECHKDDYLIDYNSVSDYKLARTLGITPQRVRNLKIKKEYVYPTDHFDWKKSFAKIIENEKNVHIVDNKTIKINIPDPNLFLAIQEEIEAEGGYLDIQLNSRLLSVPIDNFMIIIKLICEKEDFDKVCENIIEKYNSINEENKIEKRLLTAKQITSIIKDITGSINDVTNFISSLMPSNIIANAFSNLINKIFGGK